MMTRRRPTDEQLAAWRTYQRARRGCGLPSADEIDVLDLQIGDVLIGGGTITTRPSLHPSGWVVAEVDYVAQIRWRDGSTVAIHWRKATR